MQPSARSMLGSLRDAETLTDAIGRVSAPNGRDPGADPWKNHRCASKVSPAGVTFAFTAADRVRRDSCVCRTTPAARMPCEP